MRKLFLSACLILAGLATPAAALQSDCLAIAGREPRVVPAAYEPTRCG